MSKEPDPDGEGRKHPPGDVQKAWHRLQAQDDPGLRSKAVTVKEVFDPFRALHAHEEKQHTHWILTRFEAFVGPQRPVMKLLPKDLTAFFAKNPHWGSSTQRTMTNRVLAAINHAVREGEVPRNPISSTPGYRRHGHHEQRKNVVPAGLRVKLEAAALPGLRAFLVARRETGCRPGELRKARVERCLVGDGVMWVPNKTANKTRKAERPIYLSPAMQDLVREQVGGRAEGYVFLTRRKKPWTYTNLQERWRRLLEAVPEAKAAGVTLYTYRRAFISEAINEKDVNPALVAQLVGHVGLE